MPTEQDRAFVEKVRSVGFVQRYKPGATRRVEVRNELDGTRAGEHVEHYDGSQDARAEPKQIRLRTTMEGGAG